MKKIAVFASGNGSNFQVIAEEFPVEFVFSDHRDAYVLERADKLGVLSYAFELKEFESKVDYEAALVELLEEHQIDLVCLAGYMKIVGPTLLAAYEGRIINIHPAYLPEFPGAHEIEESKVPVLPIFKALEKYGEIKHEEMFEIFNMGVGLMLAVSPENVTRVKELLDEPAYEIGRIVKKENESIIIKWKK